jgi:hypothetical protein
MKVKQHDLDLSQLEQDKGPDAGYCKYGIEFSGSIKLRK